MSNDVHKDAIYKIREKRHNYMRDHFGTPPKFVHLGYHVIVDIDYRELCLNRPIKDGGDLFGMTVVENFDNMNLIEVSNDKELK